MILKIQGKIEITLSKARRAFELSSLGRYLLSQLLKIVTSRLSPLSLLNMEEVASRIKMKDSASAKKWLQENDVAIFKVSKRDVVYNAHLEYTVSKPFVQDLQQKHPSHWKELLRDFLNDDGLYNYFLINLGESRNGLGFSEVVPSNNDEVELYKLLLQ